MDNLDKNRSLIDTLLAVSLERKPVAVDLATRAKDCARNTPRQRQILPEIIYHSLSALDLLEAGWRSSQAFWVGTAARSLYEADLSVAFICRTAGGAERYFQEGLIDLRDIFTSLDSLSNKLDQIGDFQLLLASLKAEVAELFLANGLPWNAKYLPTHNMAKELGVESSHKSLYPFLSKFSHSSAVAVLTREGDTWLKTILPLVAFYGLQSYLNLLVSIAENLPIDAEKGGL